MPAANRCPNCKATIRPFAGTCESCGIDLDVHRRKRSARAQRGPAIELPQVDRDMSEALVTVFLVVVMVLFAPLFGVLIGAMVALHAEHNGYRTRRNIVIGCCAFGLFLLLSNYAPVPQVFI